MKDRVEKEKGRKRRGSGSTRIYEREERADGEESHNASEDVKRTRAIKEPGKFLGSGGAALFMLSSNLRIFFLLKILPFFLYLLAHFWVALFGHLQSRFRGRQHLGTF